MRAEHEVHGFVVGFVGDGVEDLAGETDADSENGCRQTGECPVVEASASAETGAVRGEREAGDKNDVGIRRVRGRAFVRIGFKDTEWSRDELICGIDAVEHETISLHPRKQESAVRKP